MSNPLFIREPKHFRLYYDYSGNPYVLGAALGDVPQDYAVPLAAAIDEAVLIEEILWAVAPDNGGTSETLVGTIALFFGAGDGASPPASLTTLATIHVPPSAATEYLSGRFGLDFTLEPGNALFVAHNVMRAAGPGGKLGIFAAGGVVR
jgi:hypothetical protein